VVLLFYALIVYKIRKWLKIQEKEVHEKTVGEQEENIKTLK